MAKLDLYEVNNRNRHIGLMLENVALDSVYYSSQYGAEGRD